MSLESHATSSKGSESQSDSDVIPELVPVHMKEDQDIQAREAVQEETEVKFSDNKRMTTEQILSEDWLAITQTCDGCKYPLSVKECRWDNLEHPNIWERDGSHLHVGCEKLTPPELEADWYEGLVNTAKLEVQSAGLRIDFDLRSPSVKGSETADTTAWRMQQIERGQLSVAQLTTWANELAGQLQIWEKSQMWGKDKPSQVVNNITDIIIASDSLLTRESATEAFKAVWKFVGAVREPIDEIMSKREPSHAYRSATHVGRCYWDRCLFGGSANAPDVGVDGYILLDPTQVPGTSHKHLHGECHSAIFGSE